MKCLPYRGASAYSFDKTSFPGAEAILTRCVRADLFFMETLKECILDLFNVPCSAKI